MTIAADTDRIPQSVIDAYSKIDVACIGDVMHGNGLVSIPEGLFPLDRKMRLCGPAVTMRHIQAQDHQNWARHEAVLVEHCRPGDVLVIDMGGRPDGSTFGGNITADAQRRGLNGVVIDGTCRDTDELLELGLPMYTRGVSNRHTHGTYYSCCINNEPVQVGVSPFCVMVAPGDLIVGNADGIVVVPKGRAADLLPAVEARHEADEEMKRLAREGKGHGDPEFDAVLAKVRDFEGVRQGGGYKW